MSELPFEVTGDVKNSRPFVEAFAKTFAWSTARSVYIPEGDSYYEIDIERAGIGMPQTMEDFGFKLVGFSDETAFFIECEESDDATAMTNRYLKNKRNKEIEAFYQNR